MAESFEYALLDFGGGRKLERFGTVVLDRPEVLATDMGRLASSEWGRADGTYRFAGAGPGSWQWRRNPPDPWQIGFCHHSLKWKALLKPGRFKHVGLFPEQERHWRYLARRVQPGMRVLNLFGYTGAASLTAALAGGDVFHVDASRSVVKAAAENARANGVSSIHWVVEDALTFATKEARRGRRYDVIIMDPPVFGKGKKGENRKLKDQLGALTSVAAALLVPAGSLVLNTYSPRTGLAEMVKTCENNGLEHKDSGRLSVSDAAGRSLALSSFVIAEK